MVMGGNGGDSATWGGGFAARASRRDFDGGAPGEGGDRRAGFSTARMGENVAATSSAGSDRAKTRVSAPQRQGRKPGQSDRVKRLAAIVAVSVALAVASLSYGIWASAASRAAVDEATSGALPTLVAAADIHAGDSLSAAAVEAKDVPYAYRSAGALGSEALGAEGALEEGRALVDIPAGTQIASSFVTGLGAGDRLASELAAGKEAVTLAVDVETGLAGRVRPYDTVRVVSTEGASSGEAFLQTICERARVVAVGDDATGAQSASASVTVEVMPAEADAVREAQYAGRVSLVLVAESDALGEEGPDGQDD